MRRGSPASWLIVPTAALEMSALGRPKLTVLKTLNTSQRKVSARAAAGVEALLQRHVEALPARARAGCCGPRCRRCRRARPGSPSGSNHLSTVFGPVAVAGLVGQAGVVRADVVVALGDGERPAGARGVDAGDHPVAEDAPSSAPVAAPWRTAARRRSCRRSGGGCRSRRARTRPRGRARPASGWATRRWRGARRCCPCTRTACRRGRSE